MRSLKVCDVERRQRLSTNQEPGAKSKATTSKKSGTDTAGIANGVGSIKLEDVPKPKSKGLDVVSEFKKSQAKNAANFVVIGIFSYTYHQK